jgi:hypothetical protein
MALENDDVNYCTEGYNENFLTKYYKFISKKKYYGIGNKLFCEYNFYTNKAIINDNDNECKNLYSYDLRGCIRTYYTYKAIFLKSSVVCTQVIDSYKRNIPEKFYNTIERKNNETIWGCYNDLSMYYNDTKYCNLILDEKRKNTCKYSINFYNKRMENYKKSFLEKKIFGRKIDDEMVI